MLQRPNSTIHRTRPSRTEYRPAFRVYGHWPLDIAPSDKKCQLYEKSYFSIGFDLSLPNWPDGGNPDPTRPSRLKRKFERLRGIRRFGQTREKRPSERIGRPSKIYTVGANMAEPLCKCGQPINLILGMYPKECAVCRLLRNFHDTDCAVFVGKDCNCGTDKELPLT